MNSIHFSAIPVLQWEPEALDSLQPSLWILLRRNLKEDEMSLKMGKNSVPKGN